jgi:flagella basal body P-ring formation protein FlgA
MKLRILFLFGWSACFAPAQEPACHPVEGDRIFARDLAAVLPEFGTAPPDALVGQAPLPGAQRIFHVQELRALSRRFGFDQAAFQEVCFAWTMQPLDRQRAIAAMQQSLQIPGATIEITDTISDRVPKGRLEFPLGSMGTPSPAGPAEPVLWRGDVVFGDSHRFAIWARVKMSVPCRKLAAAESLKAGQPIETRQIRATTATCFPVGAKEISLEEVAGMTPIHSIAARTELRPELLAPPNDVNRGDAVHIEVRSGAALVALTARALTSGRSGETISVRNPESNKTFQARITGKGTAVVEASIPKGI